MKLFGEFTLSLILLGSLTGLSGTGECRADVQVGPESPADFGPLPSKFSEWKTDVPLSARVAEDLKNVETWRAQRVAILKARRQLLEESVLSLRAIARKHPAASATARIYQDAADRMELDILPNHPLHRLIAEHENPSSEFVSLLSLYQQQADAGLDEAESTRLRLIEIVSTDFWSGQKKYGPMPFAVFAQENPVGEGGLQFDLGTTSDERQLKNWKECKFFPQASVRRPLLSQQDLMGDNAPGTAFALIEDERAIALMLDGDSARGVPPLSISCGFRVIERKFARDPGKNRIKNMSYLHFDSDVLDGMVWSAPARIGVALSVAEELRKSLGIR